MKIIAVGKIKKPWIKEGIQHYKKMLSQVKIEEIEIKDYKPIPIPAGYTVALSEEGKTCTSTEFQKYLNNTTFIIGGAEGLPEKTKKQCDEILSLSPMTFPHEIARLLLYEQIYRSHTIKQGKKYHK